MSFRDSLFHSTSCPWGLITVSQVWERPSVLWLCHIPRWGHAVFRRWTLGALPALGCRDHGGVPALSSSGYMPPSGLAGSHGESRFHFAGAHHPVFRGSGTRVHGRQQGVRFPVPPSPRQHLLFPACFSNSMALRCEVVVLFCVVLMVRDAELLPTCLSFLEKRPFESSARIFIGLVAFFFYC